MSDKHMRQDGLMNSYLKLVGDEYARIVTKEYDNLPDDLTYPKSLDHWFDDFNKTIKKNNHKTKRKANIYKNIGRSAAAFLAILIVSTVITLNVEALRVEFLNFFIEENSESMHIQAGRSQPGDDLIKDYHGLYVPTYIPEGFILDEAVDFNNMARMTYIYQDKHINFSQHQGQVDIQIDNERSVIEEYILTSGEKAILSKGDGYSTIIWENDIRTFIINGDVDSDTIVRIAENLQWKE